MKRMLAALTAFLLICVLAACGTSAEPAEPSQEETSSSQEEVSETRRERKQREKEEEEEREALRQERERETSQRESQNVWKDYVEPRLDEGMGTVFPTLQTPSGAAAMFMRYMQDYNLIGAFKCISDYDEYSEEYMEYYYGKTDDLYDLFLTKMLKESRFSIVEEQIYSTYAVVTVQCKAYSGEVLMDLYGDQLMEEGLFDYYVSYTGRALEGINLSAVPMVMEEVQVHLVKCDDGLWRLDIDEDGNEKIMDAICGNLMDAINEYYSDNYSSRYYDWHNYYQDFYGDNSDSPRDKDSWYADWYAENFG